METDRDAKMLTVYVPAPNSELIGEIWEGSGIVGSLMGDTWRLRLDYEGADEIHPRYVDESSGPRNDTLRPVMTAARATPRGHRPTSTATK